MQKINYALLTLTVPVACVMSLLMVVEQVGILAGCSPEGGRIKRCNRLSLGTINLGVMIFL
jgi:hypothetical protein